MNISRGTGRSTGAVIVLLATLSVAGCATTPSGELAPLTHAPGYQPGLIASIEAPAIPDWAIDSRSNHHLNPRRSESGYLLEETVISQHQRLTTSHGRPRDSSSFRIWTWQLGISPQ